MKAYEVLIKLSLVLFATVAVSANAQLPLNLEDTLKANRLLAAPLQHDSLKCSIHQKKPTLDFALRFSAGYVIDCRVAEFENKDTLLIIYTRVTPTEKDPVLLGDAYRLPVIPSASLDQAIPKGLNRHFIFEMSGGFAVGRGIYLVEVLAVDDHNRIFRKQWTIRAGRTDRQTTQLLMDPNTVQPLLEYPKDDQPLRRGRGLRLTILLDAAPINPYQAKLRAWDSAFLLNSVWSLLRQTPYKSVRLVTFNLDQQKEIFRQDQFDRTSVMRLNRILQGLELATVSVEVLQRRGHEAEFLANLANQELGADKSSDAVILLGPATRFAQKARPEMLKNSNGQSPQFFNFKFFPPYGAHFPDTPEYLTRALHGTTYGIHSPDDLRKAIQKMLEALKQN